MEAAGRTSTSSGGSGSGGGPLVVSMPSLAAFMVRMPLSILSSCGGGQLGGHRVGVYTRDPGEGRPVPERQRSVAPQALPERQCSVAPPAFSPGLPPALPGGSSMPRQDPSRRRGTGARRVGMASLCAVHPHRGMASLCLPAPRHLRRAPPKAPHAAPTCKLKSEASFSIVAFLHRGVEVRALLAPICKTIQT